MNTLQTEKEKILEKLKNSEFSTMEGISRFFSQSLDHIATVAKQEGQEEAYAKFLDKLKRDNIMIATQELVDRARKEGKQEGREEMLRDIKPLIKLPTTDKQEEIYNKLVLKMGMTEYYPHAFGCEKFDDRECNCGYDTKLTGKEEVEDRNDDSAKDEQKYE